MICNTWVTYGEIIWGSFFRFIPKMQPHFCYGKETYLGKMGEYLQTRHVVQEKYINKHIYNIPKLGEYIVV